jgi:hypothetical protein
MSHADAAWLRMDSPTNLMVINSLLFFETTPDWDRLRDNHVERIVERFPRFRQIARPGGPLNGAHWVDDPAFDPDDHFHRLALPEPCDGAALKALIGDLASAPLDHGRPLWDVYLIEGVGEGAVLLTRVHHAVGDGIALARVMLSATDGGDPGPGIGVRPHHGHSALDAVFSALTHPRRAAARGYTDLGALAKLVLPGAESSRVLKGQGHVGHRVAWSAPVDLARGSSAPGTSPSACTRSCRSTCARSTSPCPRISATASGSCSPTSRSTSTTKSTGCGRSTGGWRRSSTPTKGRSATASST